MHSGVVVRVVLNRVETGKSERCERQMIGIPDLLDEVAASADIAERREPRIEHRFRRGVSFGVPSVDRAGARIIVQVHR